MALAPLPLVDGTTQLPSRLFDRRAQRLSVWDERSRCRLVPCLVDRDYTLWMKYLEGARSVYQRHDVEVALDYDSIVDGDDTEAFFVAVDDARNIRGGLRIQRPLRRVEDTHALYEWSDPRGRAALIAAVESRIPHGVVEVKTAWADPGAYDPSAVAELLSRTALTMMRTFGVRYVMATAADHALRRWTGSGGRVDSSVPASAYPDERYQTRLMWWDAQTLSADADAEVYSRMSIDADILDAGFRSWPVERAA